MPGDLPMREDALLSVEALRKEYEDEYSEQIVTAIEDVTFSVSKGDFVSILGPSGCGKTTVLNIIAGFIQPTSGRILLNGRAIDRPGPDRGVVFQSFALFPWSTVRENVAYGLKVRGVPADQRNEIAGEYIKLVGLRGFEDRYPHELSGGMRQRVGVARVLANEPAIMLMDEPFASIDAQTRMGLQEDITAIWERRRPTIFFVTHDVEEAVFLSNRIIVLSRRPSRVREIVTVDIERPRNWKTLSDNSSFRKLTRRIVDLLVEERKEAGDGTRS